MSKLQKLLSHTRKLESGCWQWTGASDVNGYGRVSKVSYGESLAHRAVFIHSGKLIEPGLYLLHKCDRPSCVNPDHMFAGSQADNLKDAKSKGRRLGEIPKIPVEVTEKVKAAIGAGSTQRSIARTFSISEATVSNIKHSK